MLKNYSDYVNNFTTAMDLLSKAIEKKPRFVEFMNQCYRKSGTSLNLQALLLKPIQRFPQFIMFLTVSFQHENTYNYGGGGGEGKMAPLIHTLHIIVNMLLGLVLGLNV